MSSPVYWHPFLYQTAMRILYGKHFEGRYKTLVELIPRNSSVTEVCMGDAYLYRNYLREKNVKYIGLDINPIFIASALKLGVFAKHHNLITDNIPRADYTVIQASLYQFIPEQASIIKKLLHATNNTLFIAEPIKNLATSQNPVLSFIGKYSTNPKNQHAISRFNKNSLLAFFHQFNEFKEAIEIKGGRELIGVFKK